MIPTKPPLTKTNAGTSFADGSPDKASPQNDSVLPPQTSSPQEKAANLQRVGGSGNVIKGLIQNLANTTEEKATSTDISKIEKKHLRRQENIEERYGKNDAYRAACKNHIDDFREKFNKTPDNVATRILFLVADKIAKREIDDGIARFLFAREKADLEKEGLAKIDHHDKNGDASDGGICNSLGNFWFSYDSIEAAAIYGNLKFLGMALDSIDSGEKFVIEHKLRKSPFDQEDQSSIMDALHLALSKANEDTAKRIMEHPGIDINHVRRKDLLDGGTVISQGIIHNLIREGNVAGVKLALELGANPNLKEPHATVRPQKASWDNTPLSLAKEKGNEAIISLVETAIEKRNLSES